MGKLTAARVRTAKHSGRTKAHERLSDGDTLFLQLTPTGAKCWVQVVQVKGRRYTVGLGGHRFVSLAEAREAAFENRKAARRGIPPAKRGGREPGVPTFEEAVPEVLATRSAAWKGGKTADDWRASLALYAYPAIGAMPVGDVTSGHVLDILKPIWTPKRETARKVKRRISAVMRWAVAKGYRADDPAGAAIDAVLPRGGGEVRHHKALPYGEVAQALATVKASNAWACTKLAIEFLALTAARSGEVRQATWSEMDLDAGVWTVPAERTKMGREHRVPLSARCVDVLREAAAHRKKADLVFPSLRGKVLSDATMGKLLRERGIDAVPHGFRSSFRDWGAERTDFPREVLEAALAHSVGSKVEAAYARTDHFERRRALMDAWAAYIGPPGEVAAIVVRAAEAA